MATAGIVHFSDFPAAATLTGSETLAALQGGQNVQVTPTQIFGFVSTTPGTLSNKTVDTAAAGDSSGAIASTQFVTTAIAPLAPKNAPTFTGSAIFAGAQFSGAVTFGQRPTFAGNTPWDSGNFTPANYLPLAGGTMTGQLNVPQLTSFGPITGTTTSTTSGVNVFGNENGIAQISFLSPTGSLFNNISIEADGNLRIGNSLAWNTGALPNPFQTTGGTITGPTAFSARPTFNGATPWDNANFNPANYLPLSGGTMTGNLNVPGIGCSGVVIGTSSQFNGGLTTAASPSGLAYVQFTNASVSDSFGVLSTTSSGVLEWNNATIWNSANLAHPITSYNGSGSDGVLHAYAFGINPSALVIAEIDGGIRTLLDTSGFTYTGNLTMTGTISGGTITQTSDARVKTDSAPIHDAAALLDRVSVYRGCNNGRAAYYAIAQELEQHIPEVVFDGDESFEDGPPLKRVSYSELVPILIEARRQDKAMLLDEIARLRAEIAVLGA